MRRMATFIVLAVLMTAVASAQTPTPVTTRNGAPDAAGLELTLVANGFYRPVVMTSAADGTGRQFIVEQNGRVWIYSDGQIKQEPFLDITDRVTQAVTRGYSEMGLLGLAFPPDFAESGVFYVHYNNRDGTTTVSQFAVADDPDRADAASEAVLLTLSQPYPNHNGGDIVFGPDGYLYIAIGDGGSQGDPLDSGQDPSDWYASILRIAVPGDGTYTIPDDNPVSENPAFAPEVWSIGLRNPYRFSFDSATGDLYIADVGQNVWEEINFQPAGSAGGANYGWSDFEASAAYHSTTAPADMVYPVYEYRHADGRCSVTGGHVYRGDAIPDLNGVYLFGDYCSGEIWGAWRDSAGTWSAYVLLNADARISGFGTDEAGEVFVVTYGGDIYRIDPD